jgi:hypothetical protein
MAIFFDAPVEPDALTTFVREVPVNRPGQTRRLLEHVRPPRGRRQPVDFATSPGPTASPGSGRGTAGSTSPPATPGKENKVDLPPLSSSLNMGEYERLQLEFARTGGTNEQARSPGRSTTTPRSSPTRC